MEHLNPNRYPDLEGVCKENRDRLFAWANAGYKGERPPTVYHDKDGEITTKRSEEADDWAKIKRRREDAPEQDPVTLLSDEYMLKIKALWEQGTPLLHDILRNPENIRGNSGTELLQINQEIEKIKKEYIESVNDNTKTSGIPPLGIPAGDVLSTVVACTERAIATGSLDLAGDSEVKSALEMIEEYVRRAGQGDGWIKNMEEAFTHHTLRASELWKNGADSLEKIHDHEEFWSRDLLGFIRDVYMASAPSHEPPSEWRSPGSASQPDSDRMSVSSENNANERPAIQDSDTSNLGDAGQPAGNATHAQGRTPDTAGNGPSQSSDDVSASSGSGMDDYTVNYGGASRAVGGYKYTGIKSGGVPGFSVLISMDGDNFYHMVASSKVHADSSEPLDYLNAGGYLVGDLADESKRLNKGTSIEGKKCHFERQKFRDFTMSAYAVGARSAESDAWQAPIQYIKGSFKSGTYANEAFWSSKSSFCKLSGFRPGPVQEMIETFKTQHDITLEDEIALENKDKNDRGGMRETARPRSRGLDYFDAGFVVPDNERGKQSGTWST